MDHTVTYRFGSDDYIALIRAHRSLGALGRFGRWGRYVCFGLFSVALINLFNYESWSYQPIVALILSGIMFLIVVLVAPVGEFLGEWGLAWWMFPRQSIANKDCTLAFDDDGIRSKYGDIEGRIPWRSITRILETKDRFFLSISRAEMIPVPKRALGSPDAVAELGHYIRSKIDTAAAS
jgi:YcxB-like protein